MRNYRVCACVHSLLYFNLHFGPLLLPSAAVPIELKKNALRSSVKVFDVIVNTVYVGYGPSVCMYYGIPNDLIS